MKNAKLRPLDDRVVVEPREAEETTAGGIVLPDTAKEKPQRGKVVSVGSIKTNQQQSEDCIARIACSSQGFAVVKGYDGLAHEVAEDATGRAREAAAMGVTVDDKAIAAWNGRRTRFPEL